MNKKIYTGAYLLKNNDDKSQFGSIDASYDVCSKIEKSTIILRIKSLQKIKLEEDFLSIELDLSQLEAIANNSKMVVENIRILKILDERNKLKDEAYLINE